MRKFYVVSTLSLAGIICFGLLFVHNKFRISMESKTITQSQLINKTTSVTNEDTQRIIIRNQLQNKANLLQKQGNYDEAIKKYREALNPLLLNYDHEGAVTRGAIRDIYVKRGQFELARQELEEVINRIPNGTGWIDEKLALEALIKARDASSGVPILQHIEYLKRKYKAQLPPQKYIFGMTTIETTTIIRLYDHIGDLDGGIAFVKDIIDYLETQPVLAQSKKAYIKILEAYEQEKQEGWKGCIDFKPDQSGDAESDKVCMGRATKALIQSDYFPW